MIDCQYEQVILKNISGYILLCLEGISDVDGMKEVEELMVMQEFLAQATKDGFCHLLR